MISHKKQEKPRCEECHILMGRKAKRCKACSYDIRLAQQRVYHKS